MFRQGKVTKFVSYFYCSQTPIILTKKQKLKNNKYQYMTLKENLHRLPIECLHHEEQDPEDQETGNHPSN